MKSALVCALLLVQALVVMAQSSSPMDFRFEEVTAGTKAEQLAQYSTQLEQLKMLQERESATQALLQNQMASLNAQAAAASESDIPQAPVASSIATFAVPEAFSFKENMAAEAEAHVAVGAEAGAGSSEQKLKKLATAMTAVKEDIMAKLREAQRESAWVKDVENIVKQYKLKVKNVKKNLKKIRNDIKSLIKKKRQIRNAQIQSQLQDRLEDASGDLKMIKGKLESISAQQKAFEKNRKKIALTISKINSEMKHLRGVKEQPKKKEAAAKPAAKPAAKKEKAGKKGGKKAGKKGGKKPSKECLKKCKDNKKCLGKCAKDGKKAAKDGKKAAFVEDAEEEAEKASSSEEADDSVTEEAEESDE